MFKRVLIANRGEIAVRVIRACRELGIETVAVFSDADREALHVQRADYAFRVGPAPSSESYLVVDRVLQAALESGAEAIHPGYGFLAENAGFARRCAEAGMTFIGPAPAAIERMGDKVAARETMRRAGVPVVPGSEGALDDEAEVVRTCDEIGYPVMLKAAAGGGGKGMRLVHEPGELHSALRAVRSEARSSFGDDRMYVERYVQKPRHVEIQVLADGHGNTVHLFERECSIQRRHQKVIEEAPSPALDPELRAAMGAVAVRAAQAVDYLGAGTIEFLLDPDRNFYFMEMNTRIQVEHAITEMVTGIDLVQAQIAVAAGEPLPFAQADIELRGHAIECRVYAEDPRREFTPSPGKLERLRFPGGIGIRNDSGVEEGAEIPLFYDPMISKLVAWGTTRREAIARMGRAIDEYRVHGVVTNLPFHRWLLRHPRFAAGDLDTNFIADEFTGLEPVEEREGYEAALAAAFLAKRAEGRAARQRPAPEPTISGWRAVARRKMLRG